MDRSASLEFEIVVTQSGAVRVPEGSLARLRALGSGRVRCRVMVDPITVSLRRKGVTAEEVDRLAARQMAPAEEILSFLESEGALRHDRAFRRRAERLGR